MKIKRYPPKYPLNKLAFNSLSISGYLFIYIIIIKYRLGKIRNIVNSLIQSIYIEKKVSTYPLEAKELITIELSGYFGGYLFILC